MPRLTARTTVTASAPTTAACEMYLAHWVPRHSGAILGAKFNIIVQGLLASSTASHTVYVRELTKAGMPYIETIKATTKNAGTLTSIGTGVVTNNTATASGTSYLFPALSSWAFTGIYTATNSSPVVLRYNMQSTATATTVNAAGVPITDYGFLFTYLRTTCTDTGQIAFDIGAELNQIKDND